MLSEFSHLLQSQSEIVDDVHSAAVYATDHVKQTDDELLLTIERSQSHTRNMAILTIGLAVLLLLLDLLSP